MMAAYLFIRARQPLVLQERVDRCDDLNAGIGLAVQDDLVLEKLRARYVDVVLLCQAIVPSAVPGREHVGIFLKSTRKLRAHQSLNINKSVRIGIGTERYLRLGGTREHEMLSVIHSRWWCRAVTLLLGLLEPGVVRSADVASGYRYRPSSALV